MLLRLTLGIAAGGIGFGLLLAAPAMAAPLRAPADPAMPPLVLVKHGGGHHDNGRHLGWYKHHGDDEDEDEHEGRRWSRRTLPGMRFPSAPAYGMPGYGSSYPPPAYAYPPPVYGPRY
ncbi:MAG: hypothetical protein ACM3JG_19655 [Thiohalocapsa sp.]